MEILTANEARNSSLSHVTEIRLSVKRTDAVESKQKLNSCTLTLMRADNNPFRDFHPLIFVYSDFISRQKSIA